MFCRIFPTAQRVPLVSRKQRDNGAVDPKEAATRLKEAPRAIIIIIMSSTDDNDDDDKVVDAALQRLCRGLPVRELHLVVEESTACEAQLLEEIALLERALQQNDDDDDLNQEEQDTVGAMLESPLTPLHQYWTASALLGRLRHELALPSLDPLLQATAAASKNRPSSTTSAVAEEPALQELTSSAEGELAAAYGQHTLSSTLLLAVWKKISSNRAANVFRRAVKPDEAPGYTERILFPMDLGLIRKRIVVGNITTFADLHGAIALIAHNCVKYNGRESDYGRVAVDFEHMADSVIVQAVRQYNASSSEEAKKVNAGTAAGGTGTADTATAAAQPKQPPTQPVAAAASASTTQTTAAAPAAASSERTV